MAPGQDTLPSRMLQVWSGFTEPGFWGWVSDKRVAEHPTWSPWCFLPSRELTRLMPSASEAQIATLSALAAWRVDQGVFTFEDDLAEALIRTPLEALPSELLLRLPEWALFVPLPDCVRALGGSHLALREYDGFFAALDDTAHEPVLLLAFVRGDDLEESRVFRVVLDQELKNCVPSERADEGERQALSAVLNLLLYTCEDEPDFGGKTPRRSGPKKTKRGLRIMPAKRSESIHVGAGLARELREIQDRKGPSAHIRRAHWHTYWVGEGRKTQSLRWIRPTLVGKQAEASASG